MRAGVDTALARVVQVFGSARPHCAYLFANKRASRMKVLIHDGLGIWLCARRLNRGKFHWDEPWRGKRLQLTDEQVMALVQGLPWQRLGEAGVISARVKHRPLRDTTISTLRRASELLIVLVRSGSVWL